MEGQRHTGTLNKWTQEDTGNFVTSLWPWNCLYDHQANSFERSGITKCPSKKNKITGCFFFFSSFFFCVCFVVWFRGIDTSTVHLVHKRPPQCAMWGPQSHFSWLKCTLTHTTVWDDGGCSVCQDFPVLLKNIWYHKWLQLLPRQHASEAANTGKESKTQTASIWLSYDNHTLPDGQNC